MFGRLVYPILLHRLQLSVRIVAFLRKVLRIQRLLLFLFGSWVDRFSSRIRADPAGSKIEGAFFFFFLCAAAIVLTSVL